MFRNPTPPAVRRSAVRAGFTLVELLVACALTVLVMAILATAFGQGMETLSHLKSAVGLSEQHRAAQEVIRRDLAATHLESADGQPVRVSDSRVAGGWGSAGTKGFFRVRHGSPLVTTVPEPIPSPGYYREGQDENVYSYRAVDHEFAMTVKRPSGSAQDVFIARADSGLLTGWPTLREQSQPDYATDVSKQFVGRWAEVAYFLAPSAQTTADAGAGALSLYTLRRRFRALAPSMSDVVRVPLKAVNPASPYTTVQDVAIAYPELSVSPFPSPAPPATPQYATINNPVDVADTRHRLWDFTGDDPPLPITSTRPVGFTDNVRAIPLNNAEYYGSDVLLSNVLSMHVEVLTSQDQTQFSPTLPSGFTMDTFPPTATPRPLLRAVKIKIRLYDVRNKMTRQMSIVQDL